MNKKPSKFAPIFIASTVVFFLGSALKFIVGNKSEAQDNLATSSKNQTVVEHEQTEDETLDENEDIAQEPEEDPVQSL